RAAAGTGPYAAVLGGAVLSFRVSGNLDCAARTGRGRGVSAPAARVAGTVDGCPTRRRALRRERLLHLWCAGSRAAHFGFAQPDLAQLFAADGALPRGGGAVLRHRAAVLNRLWAASRAHHAALRRG